MNNKFRELFDKLFHYFESHVLFSVFSETRFEDHMWFIKNIKSCENVNRYLRFISNS